MKYFFLFALSLFFTISLYSRNVSKNLNTSYTNTPLIKSIGQGVYSVPNLPCYKAYQNKVTIAFVKLGSCKCLTMPEEGAKGFVSCSVILYLQIYAAELEFNQCMKEY